MHNNNYSIYLGVICKYKRIYTEYKSGRRLKCVKYMLDTKYHSSNWHLNTVWTRIQLMNEWIIMSIIRGFDRIWACIWSHFGTSYRYIKGHTYTIYFIACRCLGVDIYFLFLLCYCCYSIASYIHLQYNYYYVSDCLSMFLHLGTIHASNVNINT